MICRRGLLKFAAKRKTFQIAKNAVIPFNLHLLRLCSILVNLYNMDF